MLDILKKNDIEHLERVNGVLKSRFKPKYWDTSSIAELLHDASLGFPSFGRYRAAGALALAAFQQERKRSKRSPKAYRRSFTGSSWIRCTLTPFRTL
jgi:hypothetical protein